MHFDQYFGQYKETTLIFKHIYVFPPCLKLKMSLTLLGVVIQAKAAAWHMYLATTQISLIGCTDLFEYSLRATDKVLGQLVFTTRFFSQIVFSGFLPVLISFF